MKTERISDSEDHITKEAVSHSATSLINAGSVLVVTRSGILRHTLPVAVNSVSVTVNQDLKALTPRNGILAEYVAWALRAFSRDILHTCSKQGTTVNSVETSKLLGFEIPVAPRGQQAKIVAEIEKQFSRLDEAVANLKRVKANLKRYKASVLKSAVEGKLTEDWRKQHPDVEPATKLLERILAERREKWKGRGQQKEPIGPDTSSLPFLPKHYTWATFGQLCRVQGGFAFKSTDYVKRGVPLIRISNLLNGRVQISEDTVFLPDGFAEKFPEFCLRKGDVLIAMSGATTGKMATMAEAFLALLNQRVGRFQLSSTTLCNAKFISYLVMQISQKVLKDAYGAAQPNIAPSEIEAMVVPLPPFQEQQCIVAEVERRLSVIEELEATTEANLTRAGHLRQSILQRAFCGELARG